MSIAGRLSWKQQIRDFRPFRIASERNKQIRAPIIPHVRHRILSILMHVAWASNISSWKNGQTTNVGRVSFSSDSITYSSDRLLEGFSLSLHINLNFTKASDTSSTSIFIIQKLKRIKFRMGRLWNKFGFNMWLVAPFYTLLIEGILVLPIRV